MKHIYSHLQTNAYFSVQSLSRFISEADFTNPHPWFTVFILNKLNGELTIDDYKGQNSSPNATFITPGQHFSLTNNLYNEGYAISFNKEFYCIEYHDSEVSCNGLLFVNNFSLVQIQLDEQQQAIYNNTVKEMAGEFLQNDPLQAEMLKNLLKNLLIRSNRLFRIQNTIDGVDDVSIDFARKFSELVEKHYKETKQVEDYANMMGIASASLTKKLQKYGIESPSRIIKNRVITEAKRLLLYTDKSVKEIAFIIGYDDQHYFSRLFTKEAGISPSDYKKSLHKI
jgi:AraC-like DNA-binding protein